MLLMLWVYYSAQIFLFGAEFTWVYANEYGSRRDEAKAEAPAPSHKPGSHAGGTDAPVEPVPIDWNTLGARSRAGAHAFALHDQAPQPVAAEALALLAGAGAAIGLQVFRRWKNAHGATA